MLDVRGFTGIKGHHPIRDVDVRCQGGLLGLKAIIQ